MGEVHLLENLRYNAYFEILEQCLKTYYSLFPFVIMRIVIDCVASQSREIMHLVVSVRLFICALTAKP